MASSSRPDDNLGGRTLKRFRSLIGATTREGSSRLGSPVAAIDQVLNNTVTAKDTTQTPRCTSPPTPIFANLSFHDPIIADDTQDDPTIDEDTYAALIKDSKSRSRGRRLFDSYGLDIEQSGLTVSRHSPDAVPKARVLRTEKTCRVRKAHNCCQCNKEFGPDPMCGACQHDRCKKCPRYPPSRQQRDREQGRRDSGAVRQPSSNNNRLSSAAASISARSQGSARPASAMYLHMPNSINYQAMRPQPVMFNRLRQICCACSTHFNPPNAARCAKCLHRQCRDCKQDFATQLRKRLREEELDEAFGEQEDEMDADADADVDADDEEHPLEILSPLATPEMRDWHRSIPPDTRCPPAQSRDCRDCGSQFVCGLRNCSICEHERCMSCVRRRTRSVSVASDSTRLSPSAGEIGKQGLRC